MSSADNNFTTDFTNAANKFNLIKKPLQQLIGGEIHSLETNSKSINPLDSKYGFDLLQNNIIGISSRIQPTSRSWDTFTIRYIRSSKTITEYLKRMIDIAINDKYPKWTSQAYTNLNGTKLISVGIVNTKELFESIAAYINKYGLFENNKNDIYINTNKIDNNKFIVVKWRYLGDSCKILRYK